MTPINGKPLIDYVVRYLKSFKFINEIIIISDYTGLGGQIKNYYGDQKNIKFIQDSQSGTGGDLLHIQKELKNESEFLLWFVDNLCALDITKMRKTFKERNSLACIATRTKRKEETGFAVVEDGIITEFKEKPIMKLQLSECLGIYMLGKEIIQRIKKKKKNTLRPGSSSDDPTSIRPATSIIAAIIAIPKDMLLQILAPLPLPKSPA